MFKRKYSYKFDRPDHRDFLYRAIKPRGLELPPIVDLRNGCPPIVNQGDLGSCTANALAGVLGYDEIYNKITPFFPASRLFIYFNERDLEGTIYYDSGASLRDGIKTLADLGYCSENEYPYNPDVFTQKPPDQCYKDALDRRITSYYSLDTKEDIMNCLASGFPVVIGISVFSSFESEDVTKTGIVPMPNDDENNLGGHAVCVVGYDLNRQVFIVRNSWGEEWGDKGYFYLPFDYVDKLANDFWTIRK